MEPEMPYSSCFSKEIRDYAGACEHLIGLSVGESAQFTEQEIELVSYYTDEVVRYVTGSLGPLNTITSK